MTTVINGQVSSTESVTFPMTAIRPGEVTIPALTAEINGRRFTTAPLKLTVLKPGTVAADAKGAGDAFLRLALPKTQVYVGEVIVGEIQIYWHDPVVGLRDFQMTPMEKRQVRVGNSMYWMVPLSLTFTAVKAGTIELGPASCNLSLLYGPVSFFGAARGQSATLTSEPLSVKALPVPRENVPAGFSGAVGSFTLNLTASPTNVAVGDPITLKVQITGRGGVDAVTLPDQTGWDQFKNYPPTSSFEASDTSGLSGTKSFALTVVPQSLDIKELPPFVFSYFAPDQNAYRTLTQPAIPLVVRPSAASLPPPSLANLASGGENPAPPAKEIRHIKPWLGVLAPFHPALVQQSWFLALQGVPAMAWLSLLIARKRKEKLAGNPRLRRRLMVEQVVRDGLRELRRAAEANDAEAFFATLFRLLQERLGERLDLPASAITEAVVEERLGPGSLPDATLNGLRELFLVCNQARYSRQSTNAHLVSLLPRVESVLSELRKVGA